VSASISALAAGVTIRQSNDAMDAAAATFLRAMVKPGCGCDLCTLAMQFSNRVLTHQMQCDGFEDGCMCDGCRFEAAELGLVDWSSVVLDSPRIAAGGVK